jgi:vault protein inter-alpha-trypsin-like protein/VWA domain-containing protein
MTDRTHPARVGLIGRDAAHAPVPLAGVRIDAEISGFCARVVVAQRYVNRESTPIEAVYVFPLEEGAAVCGFEAIIDDTLVVGEVKEREKAFEIYDGAIADGHGAFLLDEERPDVFQASVGNLPPGKEVLLKITYVIELTPDAGGLRFAIPTTVSPRYAPAEDRIGVGRTDAEALNPDVAWKVPYGLKLAVHVSMPDRITRLESPSHPISVALEASTATVNLSQNDAALDRDFVLSVETTSFAKPASWIERDEDGALTAAVAFVPKFDSHSTAAELVFVVDRSGSMEGTSIQEVRNALQLCLRSMIPGCRFNIVGFGSRYESLFMESRPYDDTSLREASQHVAHMEANLGGTEILGPLTFVLEQRKHEGLARQVVVLTDGQVTNTDAVLALAARHASTSRIFTFGIGSGASHHLVRGLARAGNGAAEFIYPGERIESKVVRQFGKLLSPAITDVRIEWKGVQATQAPMKVPPVFDGGRLLVYGLLREDCHGTVELRGAGPSGPFSFEVPLDPTIATSGRTVVTLAARARIRELEESPEWAGARGSRQKNAAPDRIREEIIALGTTYGLASRETSFVAVERRETPVHGDLQLRRVPIALTSGWGGIADTVLLGSVTAAPLAPLLGEMRIAAPRASLGTHRFCVEDQMSGFGSLRRSTPLAPMTPESSVGALQALIVLQRADGSWDLDRRFADAIGRTLRDMQLVIAAAQGSDEDVRRAWATALALAWLRKYAAGREDEWRMLSQKAERWLHGVAAILPGRWTWFDRAEAFLRE